MYTDKYRFSVPKRQLPIQADLISNRLRLEASIERQRAVFEINDNAPHMPSYEPLANPQSHGLATHIS